ncbi:MAG: homoaconitate hydratase [Candidatus Bathyarchaeia archaeon]
MKRRLAIRNSVPRLLQKEGVLASPYNFITGKLLPINDCVIHDGTLREGEQTPGVFLNVEDKVEIAEKLNEVGVQQIECGFPAASEKQKKCVEAIAKLDLDARIYAFARARYEDIDVVADMDVDGIIVSFSISSHHRRYKFKNMSKEEYLDRLASVISYAKRTGKIVLYSAEDTTREGDLNFLKKAFKTAEESGADRVRIADTLGCITPNGMAYLVREIKKVIDIPIEVHCHNDMGLALANSIAAVESGAAGVSTCVNGLGERAGIAATEEVILALHVLFGIKKFKLTQLTELSKLVENKTGIKIPPNKPITGDNVFAHTSGIHQHGVLMNAVTYEFFPPELVGQRRKIYLDELCGRHGVLYIAEKELGMKISEDVAIKALSKIKASFSNGGRRVIYTPNELKELLMEIQGCDTCGIDNNTKTVGERFPQK